MKKILSLCVAILCLFAAQLQAQNKEYKDVVYLNDGSRITGKVLSYKPDESISLELSSGQQMTFLAKNIKKVVMGMPSVEKANEPYAFKERGIYNASAISLSFGKSTSINTSGIGFQHTVGYQFNRLLGAGLGVSYENMYIQNNAEGRMLSIFGEIRGYLSKHNTAFYYNMAGGVALPVAKASENLTGHKGGLLVYPALGMRFGASKRYNFFMDVGAKIQNVSYNRLNEWTQDYYTVTYRRWVVRGGILF